MRKFELLCVQEAWNKQLQKIHVWTYTLEHHVLCQYQWHIATTTPNKCDTCKQVIEFDNLPEE